MAECSSSAQTPIRGRGNKTCSVHRGKDVLYFCDNCTHLVCGDCVINEHKGHQLSGIDTKIPNAKNKIQLFVKRLEKEDLQQVQLELQRVDNDLKNNNEHYQTLIQQIREKTTLVKEELDGIADMMVETCKHIGDTHSTTLLKYKNDLCAIKEEIESNLQEFKPLLQSEDNIIVYDASNAIPSPPTYIQKPNCKMASFTHGKFSLKFLENMIGLLTITASSLKRKPSEDSDHKKKPSKLQRKVGDLFKPGKRSMYGEPKKNSFEPQFQAVEDYKATCKTEISFQTDDVIHDVFIIDKNWMEGTVPKTKMSGRFPCSSVKRIPAQIIAESQEAGIQDTPLYKALYDFEAEGDEEVSFRVGDFIKNIDDVTYSDEGWMVAIVQRTGESGLVPLTYCERVQAINNTT